MDIRMNVTDETEWRKCKSGGEQDRKSVEGFKYVYYLSFALKYANESCILYA